MPTHLNRVVEDAALGLGVGILALTTVHLADFDNRRAGLMGRGAGDRDGAGLGRGGPGRDGSLPDSVDPAQAAAALVLVVALGLRRTVPRLAYAGVLAAMAAFLLAGGPYGLVLLGPALAVHTLMTRFPPRQLGPLLLAVPVALSAGYWTHGYAGFGDPGLYLAVVLGTAGILLPGLVALVLTTRHEAAQHDLLAARRRDAYEERLQIAREVHDVVGHSLAVINMQAGVALHLLDKRPDQLRPSLEAIRSTSKQALAELGSTLASLRGDTPPVTGLAGLDKLVAALQTSGRTIHYTGLAADHGQLPVAVQHAALRIAQEGLTNVVRHAAPDAAITVSVTRAAGRLVVEITDDGRHDRNDHVDGSGITGIRERAQAVGGTAVVGPLPERGFRIRAELPAGDPTLAVVGEPARTAPRP
ncbi:sensor histidine kinase [uncultured Friedmanniella sp.]|uniref:sensor histidine kinase n=1 Tax=uncultured Friedmanniella sp. TaxID=335381 RepID=UPI0035C9AA16